MLKNKALWGFILSLTIFSSWVFHINEKGHNHQDSKCQICVTVTAPQLNSDSGNKLISKPENFKFSFQEFQKEILSEDIPNSFLSRAPPYL